MPTPFDQMKPGFQVGSSPAFESAPSMPAMGAKPAPFNDQPGPRMPSQDPQKFLRDMLPIAMTTLGSAGNPMATAAGLRGILKGREARQRQMEGDQATEQKRQLDAARFYHDVVKASQNFDDEDALQQELAALKPIADHYGIDLRAIHVSDVKKLAKSKADARATVDMLRKSHGASVDDPTWRKGKNIGGRDLDEIFASAEMPIPMQGGQAVAPTPKPADIPTVGSFEDYVITYARDIAKKPVTALTAQDKEDARKRFNQSDDRPRIGEAGGGTRPLTEGQRANIIGSRRTQWQRLTKAVVDRETAIAKIDAGVAAMKQPNGRSFATQTIITAYNKLMDETSVVREGEYARSEQLVALTSRIEGSIQRLTQGGASMSDADLMALAREAKVMAESIKRISNDHARTLRESIEYELGDYKIPTDRVFGSSGIGASKPRKRYDINGDEIK